MVMRRGGLEAGRAIAVPDTRAHYAPTLQPDRHTVLAYHGLAPSGLADAELVDARVQREERLKVVSILLQIRGR